MIDVGAESGGSLRRRPKLRADFVEAFVIWENDSREVMHGKLVAVHHANAVLVPFGIG